MKNLIFKIIVIVCITVCHVSLFAADGDGSLTDSNIQYIGRWDKSNSSVYHSYWGGAYFRTSFTGTTVKIKLAASTNFYASIDGNTPVKHSSGGTVNLTSTPLPEGTHTLKISAFFVNDQIQFQGLVLDDGASTVVQPEKNIIEFVGNSIVSGEKTAHRNIASYAWLTAESLNCDHTQISYSGITLVDGYRYNANWAPTFGQSVKYFCMEKPELGARITGQSPGTTWDYTIYTPKIIVINLGTNDKNVNVPNAIFQSTYVTFMDSLRDLFPNAEILAQRTFWGYYAEQAQKAVYQRIVDGDKKVHFIDTENWLVTGDYIDKNHPTEGGHIKAANRLTPIVNHYLNGGIYNQDFEVNQLESQNPVAWDTWSPNGTENADYVEANGAQSGTFKLVHSSSNAYHIYTYQSVSGLALGRYTLKAWVCSSGGQDACKMLVKNFGSDELSVDIPTTDTWTQISIENIPVTNGTCEIGFISDSPANKWCKIDHIEFVDFDPTGLIQPEIISSDLKVYPNPASDVVNIITKGITKPVINIVDLSGRLVYQNAGINNISSLQLSAQCFPGSGMYIVNVTGLDKAFTTKFCLE